MKARRPVVALAALLLGLAASAAPRPDRYSVADFARVDKVDAHVHLHGDAGPVVRQAAADGFRLLTINVEYPDFPPIDAQFATARRLAKEFPDRVAFAGTFSTEGFNSPGWLDRTQARISADVAAGAVGIKVWKNIGMVLTDADGRLVMLDDPRLSPAFERLARDGIVLLGHQAEPLNCWLPPERITVRSDREYFAEHPQYYMYRHPEMPSHEAQLAARDRMLAAHPGLRFDGVHLASLEWDVDAVARFLDEHPRAVVDLAARTVHLEYQAAHDRERVRNFMIRYGDRILYATDASYPVADATDPLGDLHREWLNDWRFLAGDEEMTSPEFEGSFRGLALPRAVIDRIYRGNFQRVFPAAFRARR
jgi:hypothetical protein